MGKQSLEASVVDSGEELGTVPIGVKVHSDEHVNTLFEGHSQRPNDQDVHQKQATERIRIQRKASACG